MSSAKDPYSILFKPETSEKPKHDPTKKIEIYRKGQRPKWREESLEEPIPPMQSPQEVQPVLIPDNIGRGMTLLNPLQVPQEDTVSENSDMSSEEHLDELQNTPLPKPSFIQKGQRVTRTAREAIEDQEAELENSLRELKKQKLANTQEIVSMAISKRNTVYTSETEDSESSDDDHGTKAKAFTEWKVREIKRILRDREVRDTRQKELSEIERRRNLPDWERREEDAKLGNDESAKPIQQKIGFMQKFYHKGVFYQERDKEGKLHRLFMRDYNAPVTGDFDKAYLPKVLQKRRGDFGKKGQSKYTHLTDQDTTEFDPSTVPNQELLFKQQLKSGGFKSMNSFNKD